MSQNSLSREQLAKFVANLNQYQTFSVPKKQEMINALNGLVKEANPIQTVSYKYGLVDLIRITSGQDSGQCYIIQGFASDSSGKPKDGEYVVMNSFYGVVTVKESEIERLKTAHELGIEGYNSVVLDLMQQRGFRVVTD